MRPLPSLFRCEKILLPIVYVVEMKQPLMMRPSWEMRPKSVLLRSLCGLRFEGTYVLVASVEEFLQFPGR